MKISIGAKIISGPYGGGNTFILNLKKFLEDNGHIVINTLEDPDIDIILLVNPLRFSEISTFNHFDIYKYLTTMNNKAIVVQRINECDERKNTKNVNSQIIFANKFADYTVYVSDWLHDLFKSKKLTSVKSKVIKSGSDSNIFNQSDKLKWDGKSKFSFVTHHWSSHWMKGFDSYFLFDSLLNNPKLSDLIDFTYIGNVPISPSFQNIKVIPPKSGEDLAKELKKHHGYITGTVNEPSGNHHIEAALCGLPILYLESGGTPEYAKGYGVSYGINNLEKKIIELIQGYESYSLKLENYPYKAEKMLNEYLDLFENLMSDRSNVYKNRIKPVSIIFYFHYLKNLVLTSIFNLKILIINKLKSKIVN